ncbi:MAG: hypothetical protein KAR06_04320 [Deltaproteobacteria bacterium]|nr:hypothetical protein [Deltaproteobacteria bacterium]
MSDAGDDRGSIDDAVEKKNILEAEGIKAGPYTKDPWVHRSAGMQCGTCMWFVVKATGPLATEEDKLGRCRKHAPSMNGYPAVFSNDWCGDHKLDENKI